VRDTVFNRWSTPPLASWLDRRSKRSIVADWLYWKVLMHHTNAGYRAETTRHVAPVPTVQVPA
jgi:hypothetical protein